MGQKPPAIRYADFSAPPPEELPPLPGRSLIAHFSGVNHRQDMMEAFRIRDENGQLHMRFPGPVS